MIHKDYNKETKKDQNKGWNTSETEAWRYQESGKSTLDTNHTR